MTSKRDDLALEAELLERTGTQYAVIGGVALQVYQDEPRTTLDVDVAVATLDALPRQELAAAGFAEQGRHAHSENWLAPGGTPVQFTDDSELAAALPRAARAQAGTIDFCVLCKPDLLQAKLRAAVDPARRRSKRTQDLADAQALLEDDPLLAKGLTPAQRRLLASIG